MQDHRIDILRFILSINRKVPLITPHRIDIITKEIQDYVKRTEGSKELTVSVDAVNYPENGNVFKPSPELILLCIRSLPRSPEDGDTGEFSKEVFVPTNYICCGRKLKFDNRHSTVIIYCCEGLTECMNFHGCCTQCGTKYYYSYSEDKYKKRTLCNSGNKKFFIISRKTGFALDFLRRVTYQIAIGATCFDKICGVYNAEHQLHGPKSLSPDTLENTWLLYKITEMIPSVQWQVKNDRVDVESMCTVIYPRIKDMVDFKWRSHICDEVGCKSRMVVVDGNEKLFRYCCSHPITKIDGEKGEFYIFFFSNLMVAKGWS